MRSHLILLRSIFHICGMGIVIPTYLLQSCCEHQNQNKLTTTKTFTELGKCQALFLLLEMTRRLHYQRGKVFLFRGLIALVMFSEDQYCHGRKD